MNQSNLIPICFQGAGTFVQDCKTFVQGDGTSVHVYGTLVAGRRGMWQGDETFVHIYGTFFQGAGTCWHGDRVSGMATDVPCRAPELPYMYTELPYTCNNEQLKIKN